VLTFDVAQLAQPLPECFVEERRHVAQKPDPGGLPGRLLGRGGERRKERPKREPTLERAPGHHWITSSARPSTDGGIVRPSAFAVLRLMTSSNFVGCSTGRSAGLVPLRILSTYPAARRPMSKPLAPYEKRAPLWAKSLFQPTTGSRRFVAELAMSARCVKTNGPDTRTTPLACS